jgi:hypothetical protein
MRLIALGLLAALVTAPVLPAQAPVPPPETVKVFLDCQTHCDLNFLRTEVTWVDYVRDRSDADLHVLVTSQRTGSGGDEYTFQFIGLRSFTGRDDRLRFSSSGTDTADQVRQRFVDLLRAGLVRYVAQTPAGVANLQVGWRAAAGGGPVAPPPRDRWKNWVFSIGGSGFMFGQSQSTYSSWSGNFRSERITEDWKLGFGVSGNRNTNTFTLSDGTELETRVTSYASDVLVGRSLSQRWSVGFRASARNSSRNNEDLVLRAAPMVEFSLLPYSESTRRLVTLQYGIGIYQASYTEETVFGKLEETLLRQYAVLSVDFRQPWGSANVSGNAQSYLHDSSLHRLGFNGYLNIRLMRGLDLNVGGGYSRPRDQLSLARGDATDEDILLQLRQLQTDYSYDFSFGLSYRFGSIFNNIVNPRFRAGDPGLRSF